MFLIGIAGGSGSGKSTFAQKVMKLVSSEQVVHLHQDSYYLPEQPARHFVKGKPNYDHPDAFDWELLRTQLRALKAGQAIDCPVYDFVTNSRKSETTRVGPARVVVFEGIYALWDEQLRAALDIKIFSQVDADIRFIRRLHRDVRERGRSLDAIVSQYYDTVRPMHRKFLEPTAQFADILLGEETGVPAGIIATNIKAVLA